MAKSAQTLSVHLSLRSSFRRARFLPHLPRDEDAKTELDE